MRTLILSDLHLGGLSGSDLLRRPDLRAPLLAAVAEVERVVLLGDVLELRHGPQRKAMEASREFFSDLGGALGGGELMLLAGNHDHALIEPWLAARGADRDPGPLAAEQLLEPQEASPAYARIAAWAAPARVRVAYPGVWLREDVYATHGHYLDSHLTVPTLERLTMGVMGRLLGKSSATFASVDDYEAVGSPMFAWRDAVARNADTGSALNGLATVGAWRALGGAGASSGEGRRARGPAIARVRANLRRRFLVAGFPLAVAALNRAGVGPLKASISITELRRAGLLAMGEAAARLGLGDAHVVFGHTHRAGPIAGDDGAEWRGRGGARLINTGSWTYASIFIGDGSSAGPYWPGTCVLVEDQDPPTLLRLLADRTLEQIRPLARGA